MSTIIKTSTFVLACTAGCFLSSTNADILFFLLDEGEQGAWEAALNAERQEVHEAFNTTEVFGDPGVLSINGPVFIGDIGIDSNLNPFGEGGRAGRGSGTGLNLLGASQGFGNEDTVVTAGYFVDCLDIYSVGEMPTAMELRVTTFFGSNTVAVTVYDPNENAIAQLPSVVATIVGTRLGILATDGDVLGRINIYDNAGGGAEGFSGDLITYVEGPPDPAELLGLEIVTGALLGGEVADIVESDDSYVRIRSGLGQRISEAHLMEIIVDAETDVATPEFLNITLEAHLTEPNGVAKIRLRNWRTSEFESVAQYNISTQDVVVNFDGIEVENYIRISGAIDLSIKHVVFMPFLAFRFESWLDHIQITVE